MPAIELSSSPHAPGVHPVTIHYREHGKGKPLVFLHGGWGYGVYSFERQLKAFEGRFRILMPERSGYGHSTHVSGEMPVDFHRRAATETTAFLDALGIPRATLWGHSDGAVIAAMMGLSAPERCDCLILEAFHFWKHKPGMRPFFERLIANPEEVGERRQKFLVEDHGEKRWKQVVQRNCGAWLRLGDSAIQKEEDLYGGRLGELAPRTLFVHGRLDPRTEPGEMDRVRKSIPQATMRFIENGKHSPHSESKAFEECTAIVKEFLAGQVGEAQPQKLKR